MICGLQIYVKTKTKGVYTHYFSGNKKHSTNILFVLCCTPSSQVKHTWRLCKSNTMIRIATIMQ
jgi:hypothetical protein